MSEVHASKRARLLMSRLFHSRADAGSPAGVVMEEHRRVLDAYEKWARMARPPGAPFDSFRE